MATTNSCVLFVSVILCAVLSLPISQDIKSVQSLDYVAAELTDRTVVFHPNTILSSAKDIEQVKSLDSVIVTVDAGVKRTKRETIVGNNSCSQGMVRIWNMCVTPKKYNETKEDDDYEITALSEEEGMTPRSRTTSRTTARPKPPLRPQITPRSGLAPHTTSRPELMLHSLTTPRPELTPRPQTTLRSELTPHSLTTPSPELTPHSLKNKTSKQYHISSNLMYLVVVILVQYQIWCYHRLHRF